METNTDYIELLKKALTNYLYLGAEKNWESYCWTHLRSRLRASWRVPPACQPHTCLRKAQLDNLHDCITTVLEDGVPGDFIEAGVYKGGAVIFMRALLRSLGVNDRIVWVADSFSGIPAPTGQKAINDPVDEWHDRFEASFDEVADNFRRYGVLDDNVRFVKGFFADALPSAAFETIAIARLDGDSYDSTMDALSAVYPRMAPGGYVIIDDWHLSGCRQAVFDYREAQGVSAPIFYKNAEIGPRTMDGSPEADGAFEAYWRV